MTTKKSIAKKTAKTAPKKKASPVKGKAKPAVKAATGPTARHTKKGEAIAMLKRGVTLETLMKTFGWQRHTVRGFISILGKTHKIESTSVEGNRTYKPFPKPAITDSVIASRFYGPWR